MLVRWAVTEDKDTVDELCLIPYNNRHKNERIINIVRALREKWLRGTKIERMATLGWEEKECCQLLSDLLENLPKLRQEYQQEVEQHGLPPDLDDKDFEKYTNSVNSVGKATRKK
jgi:hypothetical protein